MDVRPIDDAETLNDLLLAGALDTNDLTYDAAGIRTLIRGSVACSPIQGRKASLFSTCWSVPDRPCDRHSSPAGTVQVAVDVFKAFVAAGESLWTASRKLQPPQRTGFTCAG